MTVNTNISALVAFIMIASAPLWSADQRVEKDETRHRCMIRTTRGDLVEGIKTPTLLDLIVHPAMYDRCKVIVEGFLGGYSYPSARLFLTRDDRVAGGLLFGSLLISLQDRKVEIDFDRVKRSDGAFVLVQGRFFASSVESGRAHLGEVDRFETEGAKHLFKDAE